MKKKCPLINDECLEHGCEFFTHLIGQHPQTGAQVDEMKCAIALLPVLLIENAKQGRQMTERVDHLRETFGQAVKSSLMGKPSDELKRLVGVA